MPGPFTHIYTARRIADFLRSSEVTKDFIRPDDGVLLDEQKLDPDLAGLLGPGACGDAMTKWPKFAAVGAIGPDLFFWLQDYNSIETPCDEIMLAMSLLYYLDDQKRLPDPYDGLLSILAEVNDTWASILRFIVKLDQLWKKFLAIWNATIGPILEKAGEVVDDLTGGLFSQLGDAFAELKNGLLTLAQEELLTEGDLFGWFSLKMRKGYDEQAFVWSDMTHYRRTSVVPAQLVKHARTMLKSEGEITKEHGEQLLAFALGWICHVGTDVIEHSFVNEQCGGPFRTHWQRHHMIENHIDAWNYQCTGDRTLPADDFVGWQESYPSVADSALYFALQIPQNIDSPGATYEQKQGALRRPLPDGTDKASQDARKELLDTDGALPLWLAEMIVRVFIEVYADPKTEGGDKELQDGLKEGDVPHPRNLEGQKFQDRLHNSTDLLGKWLRRLGVDNAGMALDDLRKIIAPDPPASIAKVPEGFPFPWEVMTAYRFMLSWFKRSYISTMDMDRPEPPTIFTPPASDYNFGPPDFSGVTASDDPISDACGAILAVLDWVFKSLEKAGQLLYDIAKSVASAATWPARELLYEAVLLPLWEATENIRMVLVHLGYVMPQSEKHYDNGNLQRPSKIDEVLIKLGHTVDSAFKQALAAAWDPLGNLDKDPALTNVGVRKVLGTEIAYPWLPVRVPKGEKLPLIPTITGDKQNDVVEYQRPWGYPDRTNSRNPKKAGNYVEMPYTVAGPYPTHTMPDLLFRTNDPTSNLGRSLYEQAGCPSDTTHISRRFLTHGPGSLGGTNPLGDPVIFSTYLMGQIANNPRPLSSFNLDADRGYGFLSWDWKRNPLPPNSAQPYDGRYHVFAPPVTTPEGADGWRRPEAAPVNWNEYYPDLEIHYPGRQCKWGDVIPPGTVPD